MCNKNQGSPSTQTLVNSMANAHVDVTQINMHHARAAALSLIGHRDALVQHAHQNTHTGPSSPHSFVFLIQEPYHVKNVIRGLGNKDQIFVADKQDTPRSCILASRNVLATMLSQFCDRDLVVIKTDWGKRQVIFASSYMPGDTTDIPSANLRLLVTYCEHNNLPLVIGADSNAHHLVWGSTNINPRGDKLLEYLLANDLDVVNEGSTPTFVTRSRQEVLDITLINKSARSLIRHWRVWDHESASDHKYIRFTIRCTKPPPRKVRRIRNTNWTLFKSLVQDKMQEERNSSNLTPESLEKKAKFVTSTLQKCWKEACPVQTIPWKAKAVPWWNPQLTALRKECRRLLRHCGPALNRDQVKWQLYVNCRNSYNSELKRAQRQSWHDYCKEIDSLLVAARTQKVLCNDRHRTPNSMLQPGANSFTQDEGEILDVLLAHHFPQDAERNEIYTDNSCANLRELEDIVTRDKIRWAVNSFKPYKAPGPDGLAPAVIQHSLPYTTECLLSLFKGCIQLSYTPKVWRKANVIFLPKPGKGRYDIAGSWRPISLSSFLVKTLERLVDRHIRTPRLERMLRSNNQFAYLRGVSTEAALHRLVTYVEKALQNGEVALGVFADIEGAFSSLTFSAVHTAMERFGIHPAVIKWVDHMLQNRTVCSELRGTKRHRGVERGCPQGGVLSPLLWNLVMNELLVTLKAKVPSLLSQGFADDAAIVQAGKDYGTLVDRICEGLRIIDSWCNNKGLKLKPDKTSVIDFTRNTKFKGKSITFNGILLEKANTVKYLGLHLDSRITWKHHCTTTANKASTVLARCKQMVGKTWGLQPKVTTWIYTAMVRPILDYAVVVWNPALRNLTAVKILTRIQRHACIAISGECQSTPTSALECLLGLTPLDLHLEGIAVRTMHRLRARGLWHGNPQLLDYRSHTRLWEDWVSKEATLLQPSDSRILTPKEVKQYSIHTLKRDEWKGDLSELAHDVVCFTDGSRDGTFSGSGVHIELRTNEGIDILHSTSLYLGLQATVFQCEIYAILHSATWLASKVSGHTISIYSDSLSSLAALAKDSTTSNLVLECHNSLNLLATSNEVRLFWIPSHTGYRGNEEADRLAKASYTNLVVRSQLAYEIPVSTSVVNLAVRTQIRKAHTKKWKQINTCAQSKRWISMPWYGNQSLLKYSRTHIKWLVETYTGHGRFQAHMHRMRLVESPICEACEQVAETAHHFLAECPVYIMERNVKLGACILTVDSLLKTHTKDLWSFIMSTGRFAKSLN